MDKLQKEIENYHTFRKLSNDLIAISSQICDLRPVPQIGDKDSLEELKKVEGVGEKVAESLYLWFRNPVNLSL